MKSAVDAVGDVINLEKTLNDNLNTLAGAKHFEEAVAGLSAAIQLLGSQVGRNHRESTVRLPGVTNRYAADDTTADDTNADDTNADDTNADDTNADENGQTSTSTETASSPIDDVDDDKNSERAA